ncbi:hypothetical protein ERJ75_001769900 [Trypanosoma vivax]|nr:hypothetical protein ERJ75_001769900 [Trypanosoma vivax]
MAVLPEVLQESLRMLLDPGRFGPAYPDGGAAMQTAWHTGEKVMKIHGCSSSEKRHGREAARRIRQKPRLCNDDGALGE